MINAFELDSGRLRQVHIETLDDLRRCQPVWVDFDEPTGTEIAWAREIFGIALRDGEEEDEVEDIEASARFYIEENGEIHIRSDFFLLDHDESEVVLVSFVLKDQASSASTLKTCLRSDCSGCGRAFSPATSKTARTYCSSFMRPTPNIQPTHSKAFMRACTAFRTRSSASISRMIRPARCCPKSHARKT